MHDWLRARAAATPQALALICDGEYVTYGELDRRTDRLGAGLHQLGVRPGDHLAALLANSIESVCLIHALIRLSAALIPLNTRLSGPELAWQADFAGCRWLLHEAETAGIAAGLANKIDIKSAMIEEISQVGSRLSGLDALETAASRELERTQAIVFTSGTTGRPKAAMLTLANHFWSATASSYRLGIDPGDRWLSSLPLYHVGGLAVILRSVLYGTAAILQPRFDVIAFNRSLSEDGVTLVSLVPTMLHRLLAARQKPWSPSVRLVLLGGAAASPELLAQARSAGIPVAATYGLTEAASQVATQRPAQALAKPGSAGRPLMFTRLRIVDEKGQALPAGQIGEILVQGPTVMAGYYRDPEATARTLREGWLWTGDMGYLDDEGDLWLVQRRSDLIVSGGENIYPAEVEAVLRSHPAVADVCVVGLPDAEWGQIVAALVVARPGMALDAGELLAFSRQRLAGYKQPRRLGFTDSLPLTASGKVERRAVADILTNLV